MLQHDEAVRLGERQRTDQHRVDDREDGDVGADADRQRQEREDGEAGGGGEAPEKDVEPVHHEDLLAEGAVDVRLNRREDTGREPRLEHFLVDGPEAGDRAVAARTTD